MELSKQFLKEVLGNYLETAFSKFLPEVIKEAVNKSDLFVGQHFVAIEEAVRRYNSIFHKQDWFISKRYQGQFADKVLSFLSHASERFFNERPYLDHTCYIMLCRKPANRKISTSMFSSLTR
jgi:hypothetical protein